MKIVNCLVQKPDLTKVAKAAQTGELIVMPTDTVYGIATTPFSPASVQALLKAKGRGSSMPPPVLVPTVSNALELVDPRLSKQRQAFEALAEQFWPGPLTLIVDANPELTWDLGQTHGTVALRQPDHPVALALLDLAGPLAVTSANVTAKPPATTVSQAYEYFGGSVSYYLDAGPSPSGMPSSIVKLTRTEPQEAKMLRQGGISFAQIQACLAKADVMCHREV
ncbi:MAG: L-threonylcarbamoyladenylate synthase [Actinomycetaceae bacterium]|nr:L-threonylcarbamoyladenylate synthase [Actinomycetaceae bacterium]